jgi:hypothetical protein
MKWRPAVGVGVALALVVTAGLAFWLGEKHAVGVVSIKRVTAPAIANAMEGDRFYAEYGHSTLLVNGTV